MAGKSYFSNTCPTFSGERLFSRPNHYTVYTRSALHTKTKVAFYIVFSFINSIDDTEFSMFILLNMLVYFGYAKPNNSSNWLFHFLPNYWLLILWKILKKKTQFFHQNLIILFGKSNILVIVKKTAKKPQQSQLYCYAIRCGVP